MDDRTFDRKTASEWISVVEGSASGLRDKDIYPRLRNWVDRVSPAEILEIGCGQGICSDKIDLKNRKYTGAEPSPFLVDRAKQLYGAKTRRFVEGNAYHLPFAEGAFDAVFSVAVWHLLGDLGRSAVELSRVLDDCGHFLLITANPGATSAWRALYATDTIDGKRFEGEARLPDQSISRDVLYFHSLDEIIGSLRETHLEVQETEAFRVSEKSDGQGIFISIQGEKRGS